MVGTTHLIVRGARRTAGVLGLAWWTATAVAKEEPLLEVGVGVGTIGFEDYRGSDTSHGYALPIGYLVYNGKFLTADRDGIRGKLFDQDWVELNLSGNATTPVRNDRIRSGMPDLKSTLELGPSLDFHLLKTADSRFRLDLRLPFRAALAVEAPPQYIGWTLTPRLALDLTDPFGFSGWHAGILSGPLFAARRYNDFFYSVAPAFATAARPAYQAPGGYAGIQTILAVSKRFPKFWVGAYVRGDSLTDAVFDASPLVQRNSYWSGGFGIAWILHTSAQRVEVSD
jgi:outer membrane scaffolding protein for murein synthesis (MipA/OmpV family)